jgi:hypothetical protein
MSLACGGARGEAAVRRKPAEQRRWISSGRTGRLWRIRPENYILQRVADRAGVKYRVQLAYHYPSGGRGSPTYSFDAVDAHRAAADILKGAIEVDPTWRTDTPEGRRIHYRNRLKHLLIVAGYLSPLIAAAVFLTIAVLQ